VTTPDKVFSEAAATLDGDDPGNPGIYAHTTAQPFGGDGHVFAQVGWLDEHGNTYPLRLPDNLPRVGASLRALYIGLGRYDTPAAEAETCA
jgi:hypothetical protein